MQKGRILIYLAVGIVILITILLISLPLILKSFGLHSDYKGEKTYHLEGKKALIVTTSHGILNKPGEKTGKATGVFSSEMTVPYYEFTDAQMQVDVASIQGGKIPIDPQSMIYFIKDAADKKYLKDDILQSKVKNSIPLEQVDFKSYDVVFFAGGWGAAYDFEQSKLLAKKVTDAYYNSNVIYGSVCHGALAFTQAKDTTGNHLIKGRVMTGVSNKQLEQLDIEFTPKHPETELKKAGAIYQVNHKKIDLFATLTVVDSEKRFITGQNQNSGHETAQTIMQTLIQQTK